MNDILNKLRANLQTSVLGLAQVIGAIWYMAANSHEMKPENLMEPHTYLPVGFLIAGLASLLGADAKQDIKPSEVRSDTTLSGEK